MSNHRKAPLPPHYRTTPKGTCRWCAQPVVNAKGQPTKGTWHPACVEQFKLIHWPASTRAAVFARDKGICARCGQDAERLLGRYRVAQWALRNGYHRSRRAQFHRDRLKAAAAARIAQMGKGWGNGAWQHDHIRPLVEAQGDVSFWQMDNLQTLCSACHQSKTSAEASERAARRKLLAASTNAQKELSLSF